MSEIEEVVSRVETVEIVGVGAQGPPGPPGTGGGGGTLDDINPAPVSGTLIGGTVRVDGRVEDPSAATDVASQTDLVALIAVVSQLNTTLGGIAAAFGNGVTGGQYE